MLLNNIHIVNYRNLKDLRTEFHPRLNIINGRNGMGKTNILDSIYYLSITKSYFQSSDVHNIYTGQSFSRMVGEFMKDEQKMAIVVKLQSGKSKIIENSLKKYEKASDHVGCIPIVMMAPKDQELIYEGSKSRRAFLNNTICQLDETYMRHLQKYNHFLKQRNAYLKQYDRRNGIDKALIDIYNSELVQASLYIFKKRKETIEELAASFEPLYEEISQNAEQVKIDYKSQLFEKDLALLLEENLEKDCILKRTTVGIHKDDIRFFFGDSNLKSKASQGQQKSFVLALKLSQYQVLADAFQYKPIILLDDIFDKLDQHRVRHLIQLLMKKGLGQVFITDTDEQRLEGIMQELTYGFNHYIIEDGAILQSNIQA